MPKKTLEPAAPTFQITADYLFTAVSAWLLPGAGHWLLGYRVRGALLAASILGLFWVGEALAVPEEGGWRPMAVARKVSPVFFACQVGNGFSSLIADRFWGAPAYPITNLEKLDTSLSRYLNLGILFTSVSGLLNYLLILHLLDPRTWIQAAIDRGARGGSPTGPPGAAGAPREPREGAARP